MQQSIVDKINALCVEVKGYKAVNPKTRNKLHSKLEDALVWAEKLLREDSSTEQPQQIDQNSTASPPQNMQCTCPPGARDMFNCPLHRNTTG